MDDALEPIQLHHDELRILAALLRWVVMADGVLTDAELEALAAVPHRIGVTEPRWRVVSSEAVEVHPNARAAEEAALSMARRPARELVYELLYDLARSDGFDDAEWDVLERLSEGWRARHG
ncbi:MAG: TerB family tellurite resistance protein [Myxococcota bacterium]